MGRGRKVSRSRAAFAESWQRGDIAGPGGKKLIVHVVVNLELWPFDAAMPRTVLPAPHGEIRVPNVPNYAWVEYGLRAGLPRIARLLADVGVVASASVNSKLLEVEPAIADLVVDAGWELVAHGVEQRGLSEDHEEATIEESLASLETLTGTRPRGWLSPGLQETFHTPDVVKAAGCDYVIGWAVDDLPVWLTTKHGPLLAIPYSLELNDSLLFAVERLPSKELVVRLEDTLSAFDREQAPRIITLGLHPHLIGVPHRFVHLVEAVSRLMARKDTVFLAGSSIADWYASGRPATGSPG